MLTRARRMTDRYSPAATDLHHNSRASRDDFYSSRSRDRDRRHRHRHRMLCKCYPRHFIPLLPASEALSSSSTHSER